ncbi:MAG: RidA family protein [Acholeplasmataceae bacterium]|jgi:2-iminobutanoate/2-iminopropanoate deaminase|nr:RidA family protein [Acholeplasmataceae bacterium]MCK9234249.1 RidA family protein [Acholeplasmataceae bacterium]MCK9289353.1 RidA family protein [Acholeplasmataceae bacterium]MCK9427816.1 RidA family protein [Acholeplasmataceae bacterium]HHT39683.1 RidA family protein [Acholeplasmataceae bacterium]
MQKIHSNKAPKAIGPYSQAVLVEKTLYLSGQLPINPETNEVVSGIENQTKQALLNIEAILKEANMSKEDIVKCNVYLKDLNDFNVMNDVYSYFFYEHKPARVALEVSRLPKDVLVEIDAIAYKK